PTTPPALQLTGAYTLDQFTTHDYGAWVEQNDDGFGARNGSPTQGDFQIAHDAATAPGDLQIRLTDLDAEVGVPDLLSRTVDLSGATSAMLTFDYRRDIPYGDADDNFFVLASKDGVNFTEIGQIGATGIGGFIDDAYHAFTFDLTPYISADTTIRFAVGDGVDDGDIVYVDNFQISYTAAAPSDDFVVNYTENSAVGVAGQITDVDGKTIYSATITLVNHQDSDLLAIAGKLPDGIVSSDYDAAHGVLTLTGSASLSAYETALQQVIFSNSSDNPDSTDRTLTITVNDGHDDSNVATTTIHVRPIDDAPVTTDDHVITNVDFYTQLEIPDSALIANDSDPDNSLDQLSVTSVGNDLGGSAVLQSGTVSFTDTGFHGASFDYTVSDGTLDATGHVTVSEDCFGALDGTDQSDILIGKPGGSTINGKGGNDVLIGNTGADTMTGGGGNDSFVYKVITDSLPGSGHFDTITDFIDGSDLIDLRAIPGINGVQGQVSVPNTVDPHQVSWFVDETHEETILYVDTGDTPNHVDMEIHLTGANLHVSNTDILIHV
ncbi:MAG TPA: Ig-like domain-containing protein, partial [Pseudolabrys sp.]|nr:Ig-like domain-containing protein [Pseudolabrys sp.]